MPPPPNFSWITPTLAVGGAVSARQALRLARDHGISALIDLREDCSHDVPRLARSGTAVLHLPTPDLFGPAADDIERGVAFAQGVLERGGRLLVHCQWGIGRSVTLALCLLVLDGMPPIEAVRRIKQRRQVASPSPEQFECWCTWLRTRSSGVDVPSFEEFCGVAYASAEA
jgi:predicted protein tyrosine phosphatase